MRFRMDSKRRFEWMIVAALGLWMSSGVSSAIAQPAPSLSSCQAVLDHYQEQQARAAQDPAEASIPAYLMTFDQVLQLCETFNRREANLLQIQASQRAAEIQEQVQLTGSRMQEQLQRQQQDAQQIEAYLSSMFGG